MCKWSVDIIVNITKLPYCTIIEMLEKWFPLQGEQAHDLIPCILEFSKQNRVERGQNNNNRPIIYPRL